MSNYVGVRHAEILSNIYGYGRPILPVNSRLSKFFIRKLFIRQKIIILKKENKKYN